MNLPPDEKTGLDQFINIHCNVFDGEHYKVLFIGLACVLPMEQKLFQDFPEVICFDTISDASKDKPLLLIISGRDRNCKMFIILHAILPNERAQGFLFYFFNVITKLISFLYSILSKNNHS